MTQRLANSRTRWRRFKVNGWYGRSERLLQIVSGTAIWHHPGRLVPIRYGLVRDVAGEFKPQAFLCTDLDADANLFRPAPKRRPGQRGRTPLKGRALPKLSAVLKNKKTVWTSVVVSQWYNAQQRRLLVATGTALWYHAGIAPVPIRWVLVRDPSGEHEPAAFLSTDLDAQPATILGWFVSRWRVETTFQEVRAHLGVETQKRPISADRAALHPLHSFTPM